MRWSFRKSFLQQSDILWRHENNMQDSRLTNTSLYLQSHSNRYKTEENEIHGCNLYRIVHRYVLSVELFDSYTWVRGTEYINTLFRCLGWDFRLILASRSENCFSYWTDVCLRKSVEINLLSSSMQAKVLGRPHEQSHISEADFFCCQLLQEASQVL